VLQITYQNKKIIEYLFSNCIRVIDNKKSQRYQLRVGNQTILKIILYHTQRFPLQEKLENIIIRVKFLLEIEKSDPVLFKKLSKRLNMNEYSSFEYWKTKYS
jgi:hypothetical protein